jgi:hypothetical protein
VNGSPENVPQALGAASDYAKLPDELPVPHDDGAADHLPGTLMPHLVLRDTDRKYVALDQLGSGRSILYIYPMSGQPGVALPDGWDEIPGARGCTPESCGFRDHYAELRAAGADAVYGLSSQDTKYQTELATRLGLPRSSPIRTSSWLHCCGCQRLLRTARGSTCG